MSKRRMGWGLTIAALAFLSERRWRRPKDTLIVGMAVEPSGLDPTISAPVAIREVTWGNIYEGLVTIDKDGKIKPLLATEWTVSPDGLTYTFKLRPGVKFHNGTPFDSSIVKFSLDRARAAQFDQCAEAVLRADRQHRDARSADGGDQAQAAPPACSSIGSAGAMRS